MPHSVASMTMKKDDSIIVSQSHKIFHYFLSLTSVFEDQLPFSQVNKLSDLGESYYLVFMKNFIRSLYELRIDGSAKETQYK